jgi:uncharacterized protein (DUF952 family)
MSDDADPAVATRPGGRTYHLTPEPVWAAQADAAEYRPESFAEEGFIHCTDGEVNLLAVANAYYQADHRPYVVLDIDPTKLTSPITYEDPDRIYPHIYGPLNRDAVLAVRRAVRLADGSFAAIE